MAQPASTSPAQKSGPTIVDLVGDQGAKLPTKGITHAIHIGMSDLPFVEVGDGSEIQLLHVDLTQGLWIVRTRFLPSFTVDTHYHTGTVLAVTQSGKWYYKEYPNDINTAGSYLFEPAHSVHTLTVADDSNGPAVVWFAITGANINLDADGNIIGVVDARSILLAYRAACDARGLKYDKLLVVGEGT